MLQGKISGPLVEYAGACSCPTLHCRRPKRARERRSSDGPGLPVATEPAAFRGRLVCFSTFPVGGSVDQKNGPSPRPPGGVEHH